MPAYRESHNVLESCIEYIETNINNDWSNINISRSFTESYKVALPIICVGLDYSEHDPEELGSNRLITNHVINIDIFASSDTQALDLRDYLIDKLRVGFVYKKYSQTSGGNGSLTGTSAGRVVIRDYLEDSKVTLGQTYHQNDKFRRFLQILVKVHT